MLLLGSKTSYKPQFTDPLAVTKVHFERGLQNQM